MQLTRDDVKQSMHECIIPQYLHRTLYVYAHVYVFCDHYLCHLYLSFVIFWQ